ncbi:MAG TPA: nucleotidyl transferase AbiEii/AbiGii toxin family protein [Fimbriimonadaceae bacterium]|jgi:predicted nucleotidyltransferase
MSEINSLPSRSVRQLVEVLSELDIRFALVGGVAVSLTSTPRFTADVDALILDADERIEWLITKFEKAGYRTRAVDQVGFTRRTRVLTLSDGDDVGIDLMLGLLPFDEDLVERCLSRRLADGTAVPVASPEHLVVMKAIAWRPQDLLDIRAIIAVVPGLDRGFITRTFLEYAELLEVTDRVEELEALLTGQL